MNNKHPIEGLMQTAMESLKTMVDVNTILGGDPVETPDGGSNCSGEPSKLWFCRWWQRVWSSQC